MLANTVFEVSEKLNRALAEIQATEPADVFHRERAAIGEVMGAMYAEILQPVFTEHPDLVPDWWKNR